MPRDVSCIRRSRGVRGVAVPRRELLELVAHRRDDPVELLARLLRCMRRGQGLDPLEACAELLIRLGRSPREVAELVERGGDPVEAPVHTVVARRREGGLDPLEALAELAERCVGPLDRRAQLEKPVAERREGERRLQAAVVRDSTLKRLAELRQACGRALVVPAVDPRLDPAEPLVQLRVGRAGAIHGAVQLCQRPRDQLVSCRGIVRAIGERRLDPLEPRVQLLVPHRLAADDAAQLAQLRPHLGKLVEPAAQPDDRVGDTRIGDRAGVDERPDLFDRRRERLVGTGCERLLDPPEPGVELPLPRRLAADDTSQIGQLSADFGKLVEPAVQRDERLVGAACKGLLDAPKPFVQLIVPGRLTADGAAELAQLRAHLGELVEPTL